jgi:soluble lytic murein transglycosylase
MPTRPTLLRHACCALALLCVSATAVAEPQQAIVDAHRAWRAADATRLSAAATALRGHALAPYAEYWQIMLAPEDQGIRRFLERHTNTMLAERLRKDWVRGIAKRGDWALLVQAQQGIESPDADVACWALRARHAQGDDAASDELLRNHWPRLKDLPEGCAVVAQALARSGRIAPAAIWQRARTLVGLGEASAARRTLGLLAAPHALSASQLDTAFSARSLGASATRTPIDRELAAMALAHMATTDPARAAAALQQQPGRLDTTQRAYVQAQIGLQAAQRLQPDAANWFALAATARGTHLSDEHRAWWARAALRQQRWGDVRQAVLGMGLQARQEARWQYWLGRADHALGNSPQAHTAWQLAAREHGFYGRLAQEALQQPPGAPVRVARPSTQQVIDAAWQLDPIVLSDAAPARRPAAAERSSRAEIEAVAKEPGIVRAVALQRAGLPSEAAAEWQWAVRGFDDRRLLAAAHHAEQLALWNRVLDSSERVASAHNLRLRYPTPFQAQVRSATQQLGVEPALVFAVMHQESRFSPDAASTAGARGLMQVMPNTGRWLAKEHGWSGFDPAWLDEPPRNIALGTRYLRQLRSDLGSPVLAVAGYNAGPGRAIAWRGPRALEGAVYAESIPFAETRDYVKRVMTAWLHYGELYGEQLGPAPRRLTQGLGMVPAASTPPGATLAQRAPLPPTPKKLAQATAAKNSSARPVKTRTAPTAQPPKTAATRVAAKAR